jgi:hypothetical protein
MDTYPDVVQLAEGELFRFQLLPLLIFAFRSIGLSFSSDCFGLGETLYPSTCLTTSAVLST